MAAAPQTYANHTRWHPLHHFFVAPVMFINVIWAIALLVQKPGWNQAWWVVVSLALLGLVVIARLNPLRVQDRIIRLEEQVRFARLLPADLAHRAANLRTSQVIALRFASDQELPGLVREVLEGRLDKPADIKRAIKNWRADTLRV